MAATPATEATSARDAHVMSSKTSALVRSGRVLGAKVRDPYKGGSERATAGVALAPEEPGALAGAATADTDGRMLMVPARLDSPPTSEVSVDSVSSSTSDETAAVLACPICNESMVSLAQLNRHLDDVHSEVEKTEQEQVKSWFRKKMERARNLQSVASVLNSSFGIAETTAHLNSYLAGSPAPESQSGVSSGTSTPTIRVAGDEQVTRKHWHKRTAADVCGHCRRALNSRIGCVHCRCCGKVFCSADTSYRMKLNPQAKHDPAGGIWCRVCEGCYGSRDGWNDNSGMTRDLFKDFTRARREHVDKAALESNRLEKRLVRLITRLDEIPATTGIFGVAVLRKRREVEQEVAVWEYDKDITKCRLCAQKFGYTLRKHHCRVCGLVVCADSRTECSHEVPLSQLASKLATRYRVLSHNNDVSVRICRTCRDIVFGRINFSIEAEHKPHLFELYDTLSLIRFSIEQTLPRFQKLMESIGDPTAADSLSHNTIEEASSARRKLLDSFSRYDSVARKIIAMPTQSKTEERLAKQIFQVAAQFLQEHMLPLRALPKILGKQHVITVDDKKQQAEVSNLRNQLIVMEEQKFLVENMIKEAKDHRKYDEVVPLEKSLEDLEHEINGIRSQLGSFVMN